MVIDGEAQRIHAQKAAMSVEPAQTLHPVDVKLHFINGFEIWKMNVVNSQDVPMVYYYLLQVTQWFLALHLLWLRDILHTRWYAGAITKLLDGNCELVEISLLSSNYSESAEFFHYLHMYMIIRCGFSFDISNQTLPFAHQTNSCRIEIIMLY